MTQVRQIRKIWKSQPTVEGAGVHLKRAFGNAQVPLFDPFLLLDDFRSHRPDEYLPGFPWHPHRGIETITYVVEGEVEHGDSLGNSGVIGTGDVQWMTAGSGIIHQEMPKGQPGGRMDGFQLWANLPAAHKMRDPRYQGIESATIPEVRSAGALVRVIAGSVGEVAGPVTDITVEPEYLDVALEPGATWTHTVAEDHTVFAYVFEGEGRFGASEEPVAAGGGTVVLFGDGDRVTVTAGDGGTRFLLLSGRPLGEPVAWRGPVVMNTAEELDTAWRELDDGTFIKHAPAGE
jgi:redox-sensitive bicupin YhaK (pirin superfamily)